MLLEARSAINIDAKTTLTDSFIDKFERMELHDDTSGIDGSKLSIALSENPNKIKNMKNMKKVKIGIIALVLIVLLGVVSFLVLDFFRPSDISCKVGEFYDNNQKRCLNCAIGCLRC